MNLKYLFKLSLIASLCCFSQYLYAQNIEIKGEVIEASSNLPLAYATVALFDSATKQTITGVITADDGTFKIETATKQCYLQISFMGFVPKTITDFTIVRGKVNLGTISLKQDAEQLGEIVVEAEVSSSQFKLDKRIFNIGKD